MDIEECEDIDTSEPNDVSQDKNDASQSLDFMDNVSVESAVEEDFDFCGSTQQVTATIHALEMSQLRTKLSEYKEELESAREKSRQGASEMTELQMKLGEALDQASREKLLLEEVRDFHYKIDVFRRAKKSNPFKKILQESIR